MEGVTGTGGWHHCWEGLRPQACCVPISESLVNQFLFFRVSFVDTWVKKSQLNWPS